MLVFNGFVLINQFMVPVVSAASPTVTTNTTTNITENSATLNGFLDADGGENCTVWFEYGTSDSYGSTTKAIGGTITDDTEDEFYWTGRTPDVGSVANVHDENWGSYASIGTGQTTYYESYTNIKNPKNITFDAKFKLYGFDDKCADYTYYVFNVTDNAWELLNTTTHCTIPESCYYPSYIKHNTNDYINSSDGYKVRTKILMESDGTWAVYYESKITVVYDGYSTGDSFSEEVTGLSPSTTYHYRSVANNTDGESYGSDMTFRTMPPDGVTNQTWSLSESNDFTLNWTKGNYSDYTLIRRDSDSYPSSVTDGTLV